MDIDLDARRENIETFLEERFPVLVEFVRLVGFREPHRVLNEPQLFLPVISDWLTDQKVEPEDTVWLSARLMYLVGELLVTRYGGCWRLNEQEGSRYYGRYVVGEFSRIRNSNAQVDPSEVAQAAISREANLSELMGSIYAALEAA
jgi:hypothetical protein